MSDVTAVAKAEAPTPTAMERKVTEILPLVNGDRARAEKIVRVAANAVAKTPALQEVDRNKLWLAIQDIVAMNLPFGARGAYLVPYKSDVTVIVSPHGLVELMYRNPLVKSVQARVVREGEEFSISYAPEPMVTHSPAIGKETGQMIGAYSIIELTTGGRIVEWMSKMDILKIKAASMSAKKGFGPWKDWEEEMWRKSVLKRAAKYVPQSEDLRMALEKDDEESDPVLSKPTTPPVIGKGIAALKQHLERGQDEVAETSGESPATFDDQEFEDA